MGGRGGRKEKREEESGCSKDVLFKMRSRNGAGAAAGRQLRVAESRGSSSKAAPRPRIRTGAEAAAAAHAGVLSLTVFELREKERAVTD